MGMHADLYLEFATPPLALGVDALLGRHAGMIMMRGDSSVLLQRPPPVKLYQPSCKRGNICCGTVTVHRNRLITFSKSVADSKADGRFFTWSLCSPP